MNYICQRADRINIGSIAYQPILDSVIVYIEPAGDLHFVFHYADGRKRTIRRDWPVMIQACHRRRYEDSAHHVAISVERKRRALGE